MSRLENVIEETKNARKSGYSGWIFDKDGNILENVIVGDVLPLLEELKEYEINVSNKYMEKFIKNKKRETFNTYNNNACISNDILMQYIESDDCCIALFAIHLYGDIRDGYSDSFVCKFSDIDEFYSLENITQTKIFKDNDTQMEYCADINLLWEHYEVYNCTTENEIGSFYGVEVEDLLKEIKKKEGDK